MVNRRDSKTVEYIDHLGRTRRKVTLDTGSGLTEQAHKKQCDINHILKDYQRTRLLKHVNNNQGRYDDITPMEFQDAMRIVAKSQQMFEQLPANIRKRFHNDPSEFLEFTQSPENRMELQKMGLLTGNDGINSHGLPSHAPTPDAPQGAQQQASGSPSATPADK